MTSAEQCQNPQNRVKTGKTVKTLRYTGDGVSVRVKLLIRVFFSVFHVLSKTDIFGKNQPLLRSIIAVLTNDRECVSPAE